MPADLIVLATGYKNQQDAVRAYLGDAIADRIGPVWGFDEGGELRNMWRRTAQPGLWFTAGSLAQCRIFRAISRCRSRRWKKDNLDALQSSLEQGAERETRYCWHRKCWLRLRACCGRTRQRA